MRPGEIFKVKHKVQTSAIPCGDMTDEQQNKKPDVVEMAQKKRHINILKKIKDPDEVPTKSEVAELAKLESKNSPEEGIVDTHEQVARAFGVSVRTVSNWVRDQMPVRGDGKYSIADIQAWRFKKSLKHPTEESKPGENWEEQYRKFKALEAEIKYKKVRGEVFDRVDIEKGLVQLFTALKTLLLGIPKGVAPQLQGLDARQIQAILDTRIRQIITEINTEKIFSQQSAKDAKNIGKNKKAKDMD